MVRVLLVDDDPDQLRVLSNLLDLNGFDVVSTHDPAQAIELLAREPFDVVVSDLEMPALDGLRVLGATSILQPEAMRILMTASRRRLVLPQGVTRMSKPLDYGALASLLPCPEDDWGVPSVA